jgi:hypothetical protein
LYMMMSQMYMKLRFQSYSVYGSMWRRDASFCHCNPSTGRAGISGVANPSATRENILDMNSVQDSGTDPFTLARHSRPTPFPALAWRWEANGGNW